MGLTQLPAQSGTLGTLGYAQVTADQASIGSTIVDLTSLTVTVTVAAGRRIRITGYVSAFYSPSANMTMSFYIRESSTQLQQAEVPLVTGGNGNSNAVIQYVVSPSTGSHTYKLSAKTPTGTVNMGAGATNPAFILVEDIGT